MHKPAKITIIMTMLSFLLSACAATTPIVDLRNVPKDREIEVLTKGGVQYRFDQWRLDNKQAIIGFTKALNPRTAGSWNTHFIPADSIKSVTVVDRTGQAIAQTTFIVFGAAAGAVFLWLVFKAVTVLAGFDSG